ncbi:sensor histidine kinase [Clavibacter zhangzhiyongii]|uniref:sensor histidine kinase n=1 Tax=Clavibacter zhangzhiyongii TaxID=2768071 RepID=UPI0039E01C12
MSPPRLLAAVAAPLVGAASAAFWIAAESQRSGLAGVATLAVAYGAAVALAVWMPAASLAIVVVLPALQVARYAPPVDGTTWPMHAAIGVVAFLVGATGGRRLRLVSPAACAVGAALAALALGAGSASGPSAWVGAASASDPTALLVLAAVGAVVVCGALGAGLGAAVRVGRLGRVLVEAEDRLAQTDLELRLGLERARISRDVHDSVAHALTIVVAQSEGATALSDRQPQVVRGALTAISVVARDALTDVRGLVERITEAGDELLSLEDAPLLVERMREVGMEVTLDELGARPALRPAQQLAVYRIVQESLTNALKHGGPRSRASVVLDWRGPGLALLIRSSGTAPLVGRGSLPGAGAGIAGMRERARIGGGWLTAEPDDAGGFVVTAYLPADGVAAAPAADPAGVSRG